jgi:hypothetical protein
LLNAQINLKINFFLYNKFFEASVIKFYWSFMLPDNYEKIFERGKKEHTIIFDNKRE